MIFVDYINLWTTCDDICGLYGTCGQLVMIFVMVMDYM